MRHKQTIMFGHGIGPPSSGWLASNTRGIGSTIPPGSLEARLGTPVVETIANIRWPHSVQRKAIKAFCRSHLVLPSTVYSRAA